MAARRHLSGWLGIERLATLAGSSLQRPLMQPHAASELILSPFDAKSQRRDAAMPCGPGWFDSSFDLRCGLDVCDNGPEDASVEVWIEACRAPTA